MTMGRAAFAWVCVRRILAACSPLLLRRAAIFVLATLCWLNPTLSVQGGHFNLDLQIARADNVQYSYDPLGRVIEAANQTSGQATVYVYDATGNITSTKVVPLGTLSITSFLPARGVVGDQVAIVGTGFNTTASSNTVKFNGTTATVSSATSTQLVVTVPAAATTGPISVTTAAVTVTSTANFTVASNDGGPTISSFAPTAGIVGASVAIAGANFQTDANSNKVLFNGVSGVVSAATSTSLSVSVPQNSGSGKIQVATPLGATTSVADFIVLPAGYTASNLGSSGRIPADGSATTLSLPTAGKISMQLFQGAAGQYLTLGISNNTIANSTITIFKPNGSQLVSVVVTSSTPAVQLPKLPTTGTYAILINPGANTGNLTVALVGPLTGSLSVDGATLPLNITPAGRRALITFNGTAAQYVTLNVSSVTLPNSNISILGPDGTSLLTGSISTAGGALKPQLPSTGTYTILVDPVGAVSGALTIGAVTTAAPSLTAGGSSSTINLANQVPVTLTFNGAEGQYLSLAVNKLCDANGAIGATITAYAPDGSALASTSTFTASACPYFPSNNQSGAILNMGPLPMSGTYRAVIQQTSTASGSLNVTLSSPVVGTLAIGTLANTSLSTGQGALLTFAGAAGDYVSVATNTDCTSNTAISATVTVLLPDGTPFRSSAMNPLSCPYMPSEYQSTGLVNLGSLPISGTYTVLIQQTAPRGGTLAVVVSNPVTGTLTAGTPSTITLSTAGQGALLTFTGTAGQYVSVGANKDCGVQYDAFGATITVLQPDGTPLKSSAMATTSCPYQPDYPRSFGVVNSEPLPVSGTYSVLIQQTTARGDPITVMLSNPVSGALTAGTPLTITPSTGGQGALLTFMGTVGDYMSVGVNKGCFDFDTFGATTTVLKPDGTVLDSTALVTSPCGYQPNSSRSEGMVNIGPLPATGTYSVLIRQTSTTVDPMTVLLSHPLGGALTTGSPFTMTPSIGGQGAWLTFTGTVGQYMSVGVNKGCVQFDTFGATATVLKPDGTVLGSNTLATSSCPNQSNYNQSTGVVNVGPLPVTGTYSVLIRQTAPTTDSTTIALSAAATGTLTVGTPTTITLSSAGQAALLTFAGTTNQSASLVINKGCASDGPMSAAVTVLKPDGTSLVTGSLTPSSCLNPQGAYSSTASLNLGALPVSGNYRVLIQQAAAMSGTLGVTLSSP